MASFNIKHPLGIFRNKSRKIQSNTYNIFVVAKGRVSGGQNSDGTSLHF